MKVSDQAPPESAVVVELLKSFEIMLAISAVPEKITLDDVNVCEKSLGDVIIGASGEVISDGAGEVGGVGEEDGACEEDGAATPPPPKPG